LGGRDAPIDLYVRRGRISGVGRTLRELVFANFEQNSVATMQGIVNNKDGIGTTGFSSANRRDVKILKLEGHAPSFDNI